MSRPPQVLVLMATYDGARFLPAQLESIAAQKSVNWSLYASDDGSSDATCAIIRKFAARHPARDIRLHEGPRQGAAANFLSLLARPDLPLGPRTHVALADQDDIWLPDKLARGIALLQAAGPRASIYGAQSFHIDAEGHILTRSRPPANKVTLASTLVRNPVSGHSLMLNPAGTKLARAALAHTGIPAVPFHDWWLTLLILACGGRVVIDPEPTLLYRQHGSNVLGGNHGALAALKRLSLILNGDWKRWIMANIAALELLRHPDKAEDHPTLTNDACALLDALARTPQKGLTRMRHLHELGLRREGFWQQKALMLATWSGRA